MKHSFSKIIPLILIVAAFLFLSFSSAQTTTPDLQSVIKQLQEQIKLLNQQIAELQSSLKETQKEVEIVKAELKFSKSLKKGESNDEVRQLQEFLKQSPDIYPEGLVTGFFGSLTETAVKRFQQKHGIESIGIVGPKTIQKLNEFSVSAMQAIPAIPAIPAVPGVSPAIPAIPAVPASISLPIQPASSSQPIVIPAIPAIPATPAVPGVSSATPAIPATPAQPSSSTSTPTPTPTLTPAPTPILPTSACVGGDGRVPGLPICLMPENLAGTVWNEVDNATGKVLNGAVCSVAVCGRNGEWRTWPSNKLLNGRYYSNGYPEGSTYIQTPFNSAYWGQYFTNGVWQVYDGGIVQPGSSQITYPTSTPKTIPAPPTELFVSGSSSTYIGIYWADNSTNESDFIIERRFNSGSWSQIGSVAGNTTTKATTQVNTTYTDNNLIGAGTYDYRVKACNDLDCSTESNITSRTINAAAPATPSGLTVSVGSTSNIVSWTDNSSDEWGFRLKRRIQGSTSWFGLASVFNNSTGNSVSFTDSYQLIPNTIYEYVVRSYNTYESADSNLVTVNFIGTASIDASPPSTPTGFVATVISSSQINLSWNASTDNVGVIAYQVFRNGLFWYQTSNLFAQDTGLSPNTSYNYYVRALDSASYTSSPSTTVSATTFVSTLTSTPTPAPAGSVSFSPLDQASATANILDALKSILQTLSNLLK